MQVSQHIYKGHWSTQLPSHLDSESTLLLMFGARDEALDSPVIQQLLTAFPRSVILGASTGGEVFQDELVDGSVVLLVMAFQHTRLRWAAVDTQGTENSLQHGKELADQLNDEQLRAVFLLADSRTVNGALLTKGLAEMLPPEVVVTGGLAGAADLSSVSWVVAGGECVSDRITAVGFYGDQIRVTHGFGSGWDKLGISRCVTRSDRNILYELDGRPALDIYKQYLGDLARDLPTSGLFFPLQLRENGNAGEFKLRTLLDIDESTKSIKFVSDLPEGSTVSLMKANRDRLIDGAVSAVDAFNTDDYLGEPTACIAISCVGRRMVLKQRTEEELEAVFEMLPKNTCQVGFYSHGEISPLASGTCDFHNQTMTLTLIWETHA